MKSLERIKKGKRDGDYELIAKALNKSANTVKKIVYGYRKDTLGLVVEAFNILFEHRDQSETHLIEKIKESKRNLEEKEGRVEVEA